MDVREVANRVVAAIQASGSKVGLDNAEALPPEKGASDKVEIGVQVGDQHFFITVEEG